ncbi:MAG: hypothetical protein JXR56_03230, partial [Candidatus Cloacimonetes bacterium]|nr:hypothetical protein [Candidatus Cloacimonadota bacterium]
LPDKSEITPISGNYTFMQTGIYKIQQNDKFSFVAINPDYKESDFIATEYNSLKNSEIIKDDWTKHLFRARYGFELWKILLVTVLFLFIIEMLLVKTTEHKTE